MLQLLIKSNKHQVIIDSMRKRSLYTCTLYNVLDSSKEVKHNTNKNRILLAAVLLKRKEKRKLNGKLKDVIVGVNT